jgi:hypothetical protein
MPEVFEVRRCSAMWPGGKRIKKKKKGKVTLRLTVSQSVCRGGEPTLRLVVRCSVICQSQSVVICQYVH